MMVTHTGGVNHLLTKSMLNLNFKILGEILVCHMGGQSSFDHVHVESEVKNFRYDDGHSYLGGQSSLTMCMLNLNLKILGEMMVTHTWSGQSSFDHVHVES